MVSPQMQLLIQEKIREIEVSQGVRILYACESGSRAWGFASANSDYDVRFIYVHPSDWYLTIEDRRDVIEIITPNDLDLSGWELRKTLRLLQKSNPPLLEWMKSPIVYQSDASFIAELRRLSSAYYSHSRCFQHYLHMAFGNFREYLKDDEVWLKKYLYVLRPVLACIWLERGLGEPPTVFEALLAKTVEDPELLAKIHELLELKRSGNELSRGPKIAVISNFIDTQLPRLEQIQPEEMTLPDPDALNRFFRAQCLS